MKMLSLYQPWASLVASGAKKFETRSWKTDYRGSIAIHSSKTWNAKLVRMCYSRPFLSELSNGGFDINDSFGARIFGRRQRLITFGLPFGVIVAVAELVDCIRVETMVRPGSPFPPDAIEQGLGDYSPGRYAWKLANVRKLSEPIRVRGCQGLRDLPAGVAALIDSHGSSP